MATGTPNLFCIVAIAFKFTSSKGHGYSVVQCSKDKLDLSKPAFSNVVTPNSISFIVHIPVERIVGLFMAPIFFKYGTCVISPDGILNKVKPKVSK